MRRRILSIFLQILVLVLIVETHLVMPTSGTSLEETLSRRRSTHTSGTYTKQNITHQQLLNVLWAAYGHLPSGHRSVPCFGRTHSLIIFAVNATGSYRYIPQNHSIVLYDEGVTKEKIKPHNQGWPSETSVVLVLVWNRTEMDNQYFAAAEAGCVVQNVYLEANVLDLGTCCVGSIDSLGLRWDLHLSSDLIPLLVLPLGYPVYSYPPASPNYNIMDGNLPPVLYSNTSLKEALTNRMSVNEWSSENLSLLELSQLLWAAYGSANTTHRTTPSAGAIYPLVIYVLNSSGVYRYVPETEKKSPPEHYHYIEEILREDKRYEVASACSGHMWAVDAPTFLLIAYNSSFNNGKTCDRSASGSGVDHEFIEVDAGCVIQNVFLEAAAWNLGTTLIVEGLEEWDGAGAAEIKGILNLTLDIVPLYLMPIGHKISGYQDAMPPIITIISPESKTYTTYTVGLTYMIDEPTSWVGYSLDGGKNVTITGDTIFSNLSTGQHILTVYANDTAGNMGSGAVLFTISTPPPDIRPWIFLIIALIVSLASIIVLVLKRIWPERYAWT